MSDGHDVRDSRSQWWIAIVGLGEHGLVVPLEGAVYPAFRSKAEAVRFAGEQDLPTHVSLLEAP